MGVYDPTDEYDELDEPSETSAIGEGLRKTLAALDAKQHHAVVDGADQADIAQGTDQNPEEIELGSLDAANRVREKHEEWLCPDDNRTMKTVRFKIDTPDDVLDDVGGETLITQNEGKQ